MFTPAPRLLPVCLASVLALYSGVSDAKKATPREAKATEATTQEVVRTFADMQGSEAPIRLLGTDARAVVKLPVSPRELVEGATVTLRTTNSTALIRSRAGLTVRINGKLLEQFPLDPEKTRASRTFTIPGAYLKAGYNDLELNAVQHYTYECEDSGSPELWTEVDTAASFISFDHKGLRSNAAPRMSQLHLVFDERSLVNRGVALVSAADRPNDSQLSVSSLAAQGVALLTKHRQPDFKFSAGAAAFAPGEGNDQLPNLSKRVGAGRDIILFGNRSSVSRFLAPDIAQTITGPYLAMFPHPDGEAVVVVISGQTDADVVKAARAFADPEFKHSEVSMEIVGEHAFKAPVMARDGDGNTFYELGYQTSTTRGRNAGPIGVPVRIPGDFVGSSGDFVKVLLHYSYGAGLRKDSSMNLTVGGELVGTMALNKVEGAEFTKQEVLIPANMLKPGMNWLKFEPVFIQHGQQCEAKRDDGMLLTVYDDSSVVLPRKTSAPMVPDLSRLVNARWPIGNEATIVLPSADVSAAQALARLSAMMAVTMRAPFEPKVTSALPAEGDALVLSRFGELPEQLLNALPTQKYRWTAEGSSAAIMQVASEKSVTTVMTASDFGVLDGAMLRLSSKGLWNQVTGEVTLVDANEGITSSQQASTPKPYNNAITYKSYVGSSLSAKELGGLIVAAAILFAITLVAVLRRRAYRRNAGTSSENENA